MGEESKRPYWKNVAIVGISDGTGLIKHSLHTFLQTSNYATLIVKRTMAIHVQYSGYGKGSILSALTGMTGIMDEQGIGANKTLLE